MTSAGESTKVFVLLPYSAVSELHMSVQREPCYYSRVLVSDPWSYDVSVSVLIRPKSDDFVIVEIEHASWLVVCDGALFKDFDCEGCAAKEGRVELPVDGEVLVGVGDRRRASTCAHSVSEIGSNVGI